jgi:hypothetical protein
LIEFVLDETGSMSCCSRQTVAGFNEYVGEQKNVEGACKMTLTKFESGALNIPYEGLDIGLVPPMTERTFCPGGGTNLYDAIGDRIESLAEQLESWTDKPNVLFVVMTDGRDNQSFRYSPPHIAALVSRYREKGWGFAFLAANQSAHYVGKQMGFLSTECRTYETARMTDTMRDLSSATTVYRAATMAGTATEIFR